MLLGVSASITMDPPASFRRLVRSLCSLKKLLIFRNEANIFYLQESGIMRALKTYC